MVRALALMPAETSAAQGLKHCNQCGACCRAAPCLLLPKDVRRIADVLGESRKAFGKHLQVERTPQGHWQVRMRAPCDFLDGNRCRLGENKPTGGAQYECWTPRTHALTYHWRPADLRLIGFEAH